MNKKPISQKLIALLVDVIKDAMIVDENDDKLTVTDVHIDDKHGIIVYVKRK